MALLILLLSFSNKICLGPSPHTLTVCLVWWRKYRTGMREFNVEGGEKEIYMWREG